MKARAAIRCVGLACLLPAAASAQTPQADAERQFREGQKLMEERRYGEACPKFEGAYKIDGALGTLINLAFCHKEQGSIWLSWLEFREAEVKAIELNRADRRDFAHGRLVELEKSPSLRKVVIDNPQHVPLTELRVEDHKVPEAERSAVFAAEAGSRKFSFRAKGKRPSIVLVTITATTKVQHVPVPEMADLTPDELLPPKVASDPPKAEAPPAPPAPPPLPVEHTQRTLGWVGVGVGGGAAVLGLAAGGISLFGPCGHSACSTGERSFASTTAAISTVTLVAGGALVVTGIALLLTAPPAAPSSSSAKDRWRGGWPLAGTF